MSHESQIVDAEGLVKWFDARKGFGFLIGPDGQDIFIHFSTIKEMEGFRTLRDGQRVRYMPQRVKKDGPRRMWPSSRPGADDAHAGVAR